jgi:ABC-2 type transport system permease protein
MSGSSPTAYARAAPALLRIGLAEMVAYRAEMVVWILTATMPLVMLALWDAVTAEGDVVGLGSAEMARYFAVTLVVRQLTSVWLVWEMNWEIRSGRLSVKLLRPLHPLWFDALRMLAGMPLRTLILVPLVGAVVLWKPELVAWPGLDAVLVASVSVVLAFALSFLVQAVFAALAFWTDQSVGLFGLWFGVWMVFSGYVAPLAVFPEWARDVLPWLPFRGMLGLPVEIAAGLLPVSQALPQIGVQAAWVAVLALLVRAMWSRGVARYGAYGG